MMRAMGNKANVKIISVVIAFIFILGVAGLAYMQMSSPSMAAPSTNIGVVDMSKVMTPQNPLYQKIGQEMQEYAKQLDADFKKETANMKDEQKREVYMKYQAKMQAKQAEMQKKFLDSISKASESVGKAKNLEIVLNKEVVLYGGMDITDLVVKKLTNDAGK